MGILEKQNKAAYEIVDLIANAIGQNRLVHSATAIAATSRLAGAFLFKSFELDLQDINPGTVVLSQQTNKQGTELINVIGAELANLGVTIDKVKMESAGMQKTELDFLESYRVTHEKASTIKRKGNLSNKEMAIACAMSTAFIIEQCKNDVSVESAFNTAVYGLIKGSKTVPPRKVKSTIEQKKWYNFW